MGVAMFGRSPSGDDVLQILNSVTVTPPASLPVGLTSQPGVSFPGIKFGGATQAAFASCNSILQGVNVVNAEVTSDNTVTLIWANSTGATVNGATARGVKLIVVQN